MAAPAPSPARAPRTIIVGDIHGCVDELSFLVERLCGADAARDRVVSVGDLVGKGPDSLGVVRYCRTTGVLTIRGNHDGALLRYFHGPDDEELLTKEHYRLSRAIGEEDRLYLEATPTWALFEFDPVSAVTHRGASRVLAVSQPGEAAVDSAASEAEIEDVTAARPRGLLVVHAGVEPGKSLTAMDPNMLMNMRVVLEDGSGSAATAHAPPTARPWAQTWRGPLPVVFGHDAIRGIQLRTRADNAVADDVSETDERGGGGGGGGGGGSCTDSSSFSSASSSSTPSSTPPSASASSLPPAPSSSSSGAPRLATRDAQVVALGLDTGCCYGGTLTSIVLEPAEDTEDAEAGDLVEGYRAYLVGIRARCEYSPPGGHVGSLPVRVWEVYEAFAGALADWRRWTREAFAARERGEPEPPAPTPPVRDPDQFVDTWRVVLEHEEAFVLPLRLVREAMAEEARAHAQAALAAEGAREAEEKEGVDSEQDEEKVA